MAITESFVKFNLVFGFFLQCNHSPLNAVYHMHTHGSCLTLDPQE